MALCLGALEIKQTIPCRCYKNVKRCRVLRAEGPPCEKDHNNEHSDSLSLAYFYIRLWIIIKIVSLGWVDKKHNNALFSKFRL